MLAHGMSYFDNSWKKFEEMCSCDPVICAIADLVVQQLQKDACVDATQLPSLCAKWATRPKDCKSGAAEVIAHRLLPELEHPQVEYRKLLARLNRKLGTVEVAMCGKQWSTIDPGSVPAKCLTLNRAAFLNERSASQYKQGDKKKKNPVASAKPLQRSREEDRVQCGKNFKDYASAAAQDPSGRKRMHGRVLHPHEMVRYYMKNGVHGVDLICEAQWADLRRRMGEEMPALAKMVPLVDVSGSMAGTPMEVAIALGILVSELGPFKNRLLTFTSNPHWHQLPEDGTLLAKVKACKSAEWGMSTNFQRALELILRTCVEGEVPPEEVAELVLVVFSDMQFDLAKSEYGYGKQTAELWETQYERLVRSFEAAGLDSKWKTPYTVPRVVFWNLRGDTHDYPAQADTPGVQMVSGFSPNLLKLFRRTNWPRWQNSSGCYPV